MRRRSDLHRLLRDVQIRQLLELMIHARQLLFNMLLAIFKLLLNPRDVKKRPAVRTAAPLADLLQNASCHMITRQQLRRPTRLLVAGHVAPAFLRRVGGGILVKLWDVVEHKPLALAVRQNAALATHALGHENAAHARRPNHSCGMELDEFHVQQICPRMIRQRMTVAGVLPTVARHLERAPHAARRQHDGLRLEQPKPTALAVVAKRAHHAVAILQQLYDRTLHVHLEPLMNAVILQRANHLQSRAVAHVRQPRIGVPAKIPLQNPPVLRAVKQRPPFLQLMHPRRRLLRVKLRHLRIIEILPAAHRVGKMGFPAVTLVHVGHRRRHTALRHHRVRLAQQAFANQPHRAALRGRRTDGRAQARAARANHQHVMFVCLKISHLNILKKSGNPSTCRWRTSTHTHP